MVISESKFKIGDVVHERTNPSQKLIVNRYVDRVYYCKIQSAPNRKELVYFERELIADIFISNELRSTIPLNRE